MTTNALLCKIPLEGHLWPWSWVLGTTHLLNEIYTSQRHINTKLFLNPSINNKLMIRTQWSMHFYAKQHLMVIYDLDLWDRPWVRHISIRYTFIQSHFKINENVLVRTLPSLHFYVKWPLKAMCDLDLWAIYPSLWHDTSSRWDTYLHKV